MMKKRLTENYLPEIRAFSDRFDAKKANDNPREPEGNTGNDPVGTNVLLAGRDVDAYVLSGLSGERGAVATAKIHEADADLVGQTAEPYLKQFPGVAEITYVFGTPDLTTGITTVQCNSGGVRICFHVMQKVEEDLYVGYDKELEQKYPFNEEVAKSMLDTSMKPDAKWNDKGQLEFVTPERSDVVVYSKYKKMFQNFPNSKNEMMKREMLKYEGKTPDSLSAFYDRDGVMNTEPELYLISVEK